MRAGNQSLNRAKSPKISHKGKANPSLYPGPTESQAIPDVAHPPEVTQVAVSILQRSPKARPTPEAQLNTGGGAGLAPRTARLPPHPNHPTGRTPPPVLHPRSPPSHPSLEPRCPLGLPPAAAAVGG